MIISITIYLGILPVDSISKILMRNVTLCYGNDIIILGMIIHIDSEFFRIYLYGCINLIILPIDKYSVYISSFD